ncbi:hypothetical protein B0T21DRAFT_450836, partial [Apiosordaria backusii]
MKSIPEFSKGSLLQKRANNQRKRLSFWHNSGRILMEENLKDKTSMEAEMSAPPPGGYTVDRAKAVKWYPMIEANEGPLNASNYNSATLKKISLCGKTTMVNMILNKTVEEIRDKLGLTDDFDDDEKRQIAREMKWAKEA